MQPCGAAARKKYMIERRHVIQGMALAAALPVRGAWAQAQGYPNKPIRLIVPGAAGGGTDFMGRLLGSTLAETRKWQLIIDNMPGAGGTIGLAAAAKATNDGYTLAIGESGNLVNAPFLFEKLPFDVDKDLEPVVLIAKVPLVLVVAANSKLDSINAIIAAAKVKPVNFASAGNGAMGHLVGELFKRLTGTQMVHIPYKGAAPSVADVAGGQVDFCFTSITSALSLIQAGKLKALATASTTRVQILKDVPSTSELGFKELEGAVVYGIVAPKGTPAAIIAKVNTEVNKVLATPTVRQTLSNQGADYNIYGGEPRFFGAFLWQERNKWGKVIKDAKIKNE